MFLERRDVHADAFDHGEGGEDADEGPEGDEDIADGFLGFFAVAQEVGDEVREMRPRRGGDEAIEVVVDVDVPGAHVAVYLALAAHSISI